ncbi:GTP-binding protein TypA/BipA [Thermoclostridium stercorarium subsp. stercorarium DSM 8532]|jgi:GTP-binding protein|uniref:Large ribosomal subunit assembly factor BipA n=3 Tax=Thermoclostridium stercorarium TaxID=1510 RepID=L7VNX5_THES1|nr:translational GTPase TypA [Thermoclostridium stercorarium]AGC68487.1 GTP-binding protein TypA/BipA [Thermoclostridium stercorarium subsp. stercorarium DSM 8532]AGI39505.1 TypA [Thermoclostridium stercorarium subsp. stercorarium DSM 8532]ANW98849.1 GTP-binding protein TypA [Thermoclostridium stercorarium subsp. thermolacticum DSM 2910]ANX01374.1 GTP-binding protein TypA [Thermoclostridium stercorarium subsp. leptospartum DSM 9219]UZQ84473.1 translational GTPase TypA [Thermoclostridium sterco
MNKVRSDIRNIAIIAHVDHGKTTLVDAMLKQSGIFRVNEKVQERVLDSNELEREKGITIMSKNTAISYNGVRINIVDTPGHADFGGEVERILKMVDGVLLLVDAYEGPMPQTRFVLRKALGMNLKPIVVINKIDRKEARPNEVIDEIFDLFIELEASDEQLDFPVVYASGREGVAYYNLGDDSKDLRPLFETILNYIPAPQGDADAPFQLLISSIDYDDYVGRIAIGKIERGTISEGDRVVVCRKDGRIEPVKISSIQVFRGLKRLNVEKAEVGEIVCITGCEDITIGDTVCDAEHPEPLPFVDIEEPTISMQFLVNNSPFAGKEGAYVTSRHLRERLFKELETNLSLRVEETDSPDNFKVSGRGELHLSILIETMRREGYEFQVSKPEVITKYIDGVLCEPVEYVVIDVPEEYMGPVMEELGARKGEIVNIHPPNQGVVRLEFRVPSRGLIGFRSRFLTTTRGNGIMNHVFDGYEPYKGEIRSRDRGSLIASETGEAVPYGLYNAQERGTLFIGPGEMVYEGMVVGESNRVDDIVVNVCRKKHVTNMRAAGSDEALRLTPPKVLSLEECLEFIADDELIEVTPQHIRLRKKILNAELRAKEKKKDKMNT